MIGVLIFGKDIEMEEAVSGTPEMEELPAISGLARFIVGTGIFLAGLGLAAAPAFLHHFGLLTLFWAIALSPVSVSWALSIGLGFYNEIADWKSASAGFVLYCNLLSIVATVATVIIVLLIELGLFVYDLM
jgi:hypothetical protein